MALFSSQSEHFENWANFCPLVQILITPSHWKAFGPTKAYDYLSELQYSSAFKFYQLILLEKYFSTITWIPWHALHCNWLCPSTTVLWLLLTHCSLCAWKTANLPTENQVPLVNSLASTQSALQWLQKLSCDILSQAKKTINLENKFIQDWKWCQQSLFSLQTNCCILYFIKAHGVFLYLGVLKINLQPNKHHRLNTSRKTWSTQHSRQTIINTIRDSFETYQPSKMTSRQTWYRIMLQSWVLHVELSPGSLLTHKQKQMHVHDSSTLLRVQT